MSLPDDVTNNHINKQKLAIAAEGQGQGQGTHVGKLSPVGLGISRKHRQWDARLPSSAGSQANKQAVRQAT